MSDDHNGRDPEQSEQERDEEDAEERSAPSGSIVYAAILREGESELCRPVSALAWSGLAAGLSMGFSFVAEGLLDHHLPAGETSDLVSKFGYSFGFLIVVLGRQQLFTESTLTAVLPVLDRKTFAILRRMLKLWGTVLTANLVGAVMFAWGLASLPILNREVIPTFVALAESPSGSSPFANFVGAIFAGWLIALMVWLLPFAESGRIWVIIIVTYVVGLGHFPHIIAGSVKVLFGVFAGATPLSFYLLDYALPALIGNIVGGVTLVAVLGHVQVVSGRSAIDL